MKKFIFREVDGIITINVFASSFFNAFQRLKKLVTNPDDYVCENEWA